MDEESSKPDQKPIMRPADGNNHSDRSRKRRKICFVMIAVVLALALLFLILGLTVFRAKRPVTAVNSTTLKDLDFSADIARLRININATVEANITVNNPNRVGFKYKSTTAYLKYRDAVVGEAPVPAGKIGARETQNMNITLTLMADRLLSNSNLISDVTSGPS